MTCQAKLPRGCGEVSIHCGCGLVADAALAEAHRADLAAGVAADAAGELALARTASARRALMASSAAMRSSQRRLAGGSGLGSPTSVVDEVRLAHVAPGQRVGHGLGGERSGVPAPGSRRDAAAAHADDDDVLALRPASRAEPGDRLGVAALDHDAGLAEARVTAGAGVTGRSRGCARSAWSKIEPVGVGGVRDEGGAGAAAGRPPSRSRPPTAASAGEQRVWSPSSSTAPSWSAPRPCEAAATGEAPRRGRGSRRTARARTRSAVSLTTSRHLPPSEAETQRERQALGCRRPGSPEQLAEDRRSAAGRGSCRRCSGSRRGGSRRRSRRRRRARTP